MEVLGRTQQQQRQQSELVVPEEQPNRVPSMIMVLRSMPRRWTLGVAMQTPALPPSMLGCQSPGPIRIQSPGLAAFTAAAMVLY
ncbi:MAG TPA: hypothetical protein VFA95_05875 [Gammaproteobacteria bacterium]|nr:hypothetical protein [Gammaproteobacteria bacterium]